MCWDGCRARNLFCPNNPEQLRWCIKCQMWLHVSCCKKYSSAQPGVPHSTWGQGHFVNNRQPFHRAALDVEHIVALPIMRLPRAEGGTKPAGAPLSIEMVSITALDWYHKGRIQRTGGWLKKLLRESRAHRCTRLIHKTLRILLTRFGEGEFPYMFCPQCKACSL